MSSNETVHVDTEKLKQAAYTLLRLQGSVESATSNFIRDCNEGSEAIGNDKTGKKFHDQFDSHEKDLLQAGSDLTGVVGQVSDEVRALVRKLENVEQASTDTSQRLNSEMNNG